MNIEEIKEAVGMFLSEEEIKIILEKVKWETGKRIFENEENVSLINTQAKAICEAQRDKLKGLL